MIYKVVFRAGGTLQDINLSSVLDAARKHIGFGMNVGLWNDGKAWLYSAQGVIMGQVKECKE